MAKNDIPEDDSPIQFIVLEKSLLGNELFEEGAVVTLPKGTLPAGNLRAVDARGEALRAAYEASNRARVAQMNEQYGNTPLANGVDPVALSKAIAAAVADALQTQAAEAATQAAVIAELQAQVAELQKPALA
jgi:hypothetical protein